MNYVKSNNNKIPFDKKYFVEMEKFVYNSKNSRFIFDNLNSEGYILLKNFFDKSQINRLREYYFSLFPKDTIIKKNTQLVEGIYSGKIFNVQFGEVDHPAYTFVRSKILKNFTKGKKLIKFMTNYFQTEVILLPRIIARHLNRDSNTSAKAHCDSQWIEGDCLTSWIVLGDCPIKSGGLVYLEKSNNIEINDIKTTFPQFLNTKWITNDLKKLSQITKKRWVYNNYESGDLIIHKPDIIHASLDSHSDNMRLSVELRFIPIEHQIDSRWEKEWTGGDGY